MKKTAKLLWYARTVYRPLGGPPLKDTRGNEGDIELRIRIYAFTGDAPTEEDAIREESLRMRDADLPVNWTESNLCRAAETILGVVVE